MPHESPALIPHLVVDRAADAIEFYQRAFGFEEVHRMPMPDGKIMHAQLKLGDAVIFLVDEFPSPKPGISRSPKTLGGTSVTIHLNSNDVDAAFRRATDAGATAVMPPTDMFWGDRFAKIEDPFGHHWSIATHKEDIPFEEMQKRGLEAMARWNKK